MSNFVKSLPNIELIDDSGEKRRFHDIINHDVVIINMFYSNCKIKCQPLGRLMRRINKLLGDLILENDIHFISISIDAENDSVEDINRFKNIVHEDDCYNWKFYTGNFQEIEKLRYKLGMYSPEPEIDAVKSNHSGNFMIMNSMGFVKHTQSFDNPVDIARKMVQVIPKNFMRHAYSLDRLNYHKLTDTELFENIQTMNSVFTVAFLPDNIKEKYDEHAEKQRGFQYDPLKKKLCCCNPRT